MQPKLPENYRQNIAGLRASPSLSDLRRMAPQPARPAANISSEPTYRGETQMRIIKPISLCIVVLSATGLPPAAPGASAEELHGHNVCRTVGGVTPEPLGDREGHALMLSLSSCQITEGPLAGAVLTETGMLEWDGPKAKELTGYGVARKPGSTYTFQHTDGTLEVTMTDGKPGGWTASGHGNVTMATGSWASLNGKKFEWSGKGTGPDVFEADYTFK
jgi:hypothetical protein